MFIFAWFFFILCRFHQSLPILSLNLYIINMTENKFGRRKLLGPHSFKDEWRLIFQVIAIKSILIIYFFLLSRSFTNKGTILFLPRHLRIRKICNKNASIDCLTGKYAEIHDGQKKKKNHNVLLFQFTGLNISFIQMSTNQLIVNDSFFLCLASKNSIDDNSFFP